MTLPESRSWALGKYIVRQVLRLDNPAFAQFIIMRGLQVVGYSFSMPNLSQCVSTERITASGRYVKESRPLKSYSYRLKKENADSARKAQRSVQVSKILAKIG